MERGELLGGLLDGLGIGHIIGFGDGLLGELNLGPRKILTGGNKIGNDGFLSMDGGENC